MDKATITANKAQEAVFDAPFNFEPKCEIDAWIIALEAEEQLAGPTASGNPEPDSLPRIARLGDYLVELKLIEPSDLKKALDYQQAYAVEGGHILLGEALVELGVIDDETLESAVGDLIAELRWASRSSLRGRGNAYQNAISKLCAGQTAALFPYQSRW